MIRRVSQGHIKKRIQYGLWLIVALKLLLFPVPWVTSSMAILSADELEFAASDGILWESKLQDIGSIRNGEDGKKSLKILLFVIWASGALFFAVKFIAQNYMLKKTLIANRRKYRQKAVPLKVYVVDELASPCLYNGKIYARGDQVRKLRNRRNQQNLHFRWSRVAWTGCLR